MKKVIFIISLILTVFAPVFAQGIVGTWLREDDGAWYIFKADGTVERSPLWYSTSGKYKILNGDSLEIYWEEGEQRYGYELSENILTLSIGGGGSDYRRVKPDEKIVLQSNETMGYVARPENNVYKRILPNYNGFWNERDIYGDERHYKSMKVTDFLDYYPDRLDIVRNEAYARYGRPFLNKKYKDYFSAQSWY